MKKILLATVAAIGMAGSAVAADLPARMHTKAPPVVAPVFTWTGCYVGGFVGGAFAQKDATATQEYGPAGNALVASYNYSYSLDSSFIGGGTLGCNYQMLGSPFVVGLEGEGGYMGLKGSAYDPFDRTISAQTKVGNGYGIVAGRLGYAWDRALIYAKGGVAFVNVESTLYDAVYGLSASTSKTEATWTVGAGIEYAFDPNWSIKAEYMYIGLDKTYSPSFVVPAGYAAIDNKIDGIHTAKVGINYRFNFGGAPLVAKY